MRCGTAKSFRARLRRLTFVRCLMAHTAFVKFGILAVSNRREIMKDLIIDWSVLLLVALIIFGGG